VDAAAKMGLHATRFTDVPALRSFLGELGVL
jgi:hypothetical protein